MKVSSLSGVSARPEGEMFLNLDYNVVMCDKCNCIIGERSICECDCHPEGTVLKFSSVEGQEALEPIRRYLDS